MDAVGFSEPERRSSAMRLSDLADFDDLPTFSSLNTTSSASIKLPDLTVYDLTEWIDRFVSVEAPRNFADSGQYGLSFATLQADTLFWQIVPVLVYTRSTGVSLNSQHVLVQVLTHERVSWALDELLNQLHAFASLG
jgi:hypothetical protein